MFIALILTFISAIFFPGIIIRTKSIASGRKGAGILQPMKDIWVLMHKGNVFSKTTSVIFKIAPVISFATICSVLLVIPFGKLGSVVSFEGDFVFFAYMLAFGKFFMIISALDTGSSFEGMGANREALYSMLVEPAFFILIATFTLLTGYTSFSSIFSAVNFNADTYYIIGIIAFYLFVQIAMIENSRLPVDDPKTHLELTMVHEVMILDNSGFDLALIHFTNALKFSLYGLLIANCIFPSIPNIYLQYGIFFVVQILFAIVVGYLESFRARNRMMRNPQFILTLSSIALIGFLLVLILHNLK